MEVVAYYISDSGSSSCTTSTSGSRVVRVIAGEVLVVIRIAMVVPLQRCKTSDGDTDSGSGRSRSEVFV